MPFVFEGHNLMVLVRQIDEGRLKAFEEDLSARMLELCDHPPANEALVERIDFYPDFEETLRQ